MNFWLRPWHVIVLAYLALRRVCLFRSSASLLSAPFVGDVTAALSHKPQHGALAVPCSVPVGTGRGGVN